MAFENITTDLVQKTWTQSFGAFSYNLFHSPLFTVIKILAAIYVAVLIVDLILLMILGGVGENLRKNRRGINVPTRSEALRKWKRIRQRLQKKDSNYYKAAILEADQFVEKILVDTGYKGDNMDERITQLQAQNISSFAQLQQAHDMSIRIIQEKDFDLTHKQASEILSKYEKFLDDFEIFG